MESFQPVCEEYVVYEAEKEPIPPYDLPCCIPYDCEQRNQRKKTDNPYTIAITTSTRNYSALPFAPADHAFIRNTLVYIDAVITTSGVQLNFRVMPWDTHNVDVPDFS